MQSYIINEKLKQWCNYLLQINISRNFGWIDNTSAVTWETHYYDNKTRYTIRVSWPMLKYIIYFFKLISKHSHAKKYSRIIKCHKPFK